MIFEIIYENAKPKAQPRTPADWVALGVEYAERKSTITAKSFAEEKGIVYGTFTKAMHRHKQAIIAALQDKQRKKIPKMSRRDTGIQLINDFRSSLRKASKDTVAARNHKSAKWFQETIKKSVRGHQVSKPVVGRLYTFVYEAKYKDTLPYWDRFPLIVFLGTSVTKAGNTVFYGLNLHYIPPKARQAFLEELLKNYANTKTITNKTKLKINWSNVRGMRGSDLMIKAYLPSHVKGTILEIKPADWASVIYLPLQQFMSQGKRYSARKVWAKY